MIQIFYLSYITLTISSPLPSDFVVKVFYSSRFFCQLSQITCTFILLLIVLHFCTWNPSKWICCLPILAPNLCSNDYMVNCVYFYTTADSIRRHSFSKRAVLFWVDRVLKSFQTLFSVHLLSGSPETGLKAFTTDILSAFTGIQLMLIWLHGHSHF